jgi:hypothetical protein
MRTRVLTALLAVAAALAVMPAVAQAGRYTSLRVRACETGDKPSERLVTFYARMRAVRGTKRMMIRFKLIDRSSEGISFVPVPRQLARWRKSRRRVRRFGYSQTITALQLGGVYAAIVEFRWVGKHRKTIKRVRRRSADCQQDGALPNLALSGVTARRGDARGTALYTVQVTNRGRGEARAMKVDLFVDGAAADAAQIDALAPGETKTVEITGPACRVRVRAVVDRRDAIPETTEDDNSRRSRCPPLAR